MIKPTIGRAVWFYTGGKKHFESGVQPCAATVAYVHSDRMINIGFFGPNGEVSAATGVQMVQEGDEIPTGPFCMWMPFQIGQAKEARGLAAKEAVA